VKVIYLRANDEAEMEVILASCGMWNKGFVGQSPGDALDVIGPVYVAGASVKNGDGDTVEAQQLVPGYHANLLLMGDVPTALAEITIPAPVNPVRVFAGVRK
jgi:hypothetical protein